jgi:hypothetical protein
MLSVLQLPQKTTLMKKGKRRRMRRLGVTRQILERPQQRSEARKRGHGQEMAPKGGEVDGRAVQMALLLLLMLLLLLILMLMLMMMMTMMTAKMMKKVTSVMKVFLAGLNKAIFH